MFSLLNLIAAGKESGQKIQEQLCSELSLPVCACKPHTGNLRQKDQLGLHSVTLSQKQFVFNLSSRRGSKAL